MFKRRLPDPLHEATAKVAGLERLHAVCELNMDGTILTANARFLEAVGYGLAELQGKHHSVLVSDEDATTPAYRAFWDKLTHGQCLTGQFKRAGKDGREVWIEGSYVPILDAQGRPYKVVKFATEVTQQKLEHVDLASQVAAMSRSQAVIEFGLDGTILHANQNFLDVMGYSLAEVKGRHHGLFVTEAERTSEAYAAFWAKLRRGEFHSGRYRRIGKGGREVWIEASYNPILDLHGRPAKVIKYAIDISAQAALSANLESMILQIDQAVERSNAEAGLAASSARATASDVQTMAASTEEIAASVREIADMMGKSNEASDAAHAQTLAAAEATRRLTQTSAAMGGIVDVIRTIAGQINLLALNATIESARAGDAGRGFAVVAAEVKSLSRQASGATDRIAGEIERLQAVSRDVAQALTGIETSIASVRQYVTGTSGAVEEQSAVTRDMSSRMQTAAGRVSGIHDNMASISATVAQVSATVGATKKAVHTLAH